MEFAEVKSYLEQNKGNADVKKLIESMAPITLDTATKFIQDNPDGRKWLNEQSDQAVNKAVITAKEKFKTEEVPKLIDAEIKKRHPDETPEMKRIADLEKKAQDAENAAKREKLLNQAIKIASEKKVPTDLVELILGQDEDSTKANLETYSKVFTDHVNTAVEAKFKENGRDVRTKTAQVSHEDVASMSPERKLSFANEMAFNKT